MRVFIKGIYQTRFGELWGKSLEDLLFEASLGALKDARLAPTELQAVYLANMLAGETVHQEHLSGLFTEFLKIKAPIIRVEAACASGGVAVHQAFLTLQSSQYKNILVVGAEKMTDLLPDEISTALMAAASVKNELSSGLNFVGLYALLAQKYLEKFEATERDLAYVPVKNHYHASFNPLAQFPFKITLDDVLKSRLIAPPLKLLDCSPITDGAAALVLSNKKEGTRIKIRASGLAHDSLSLEKRKSLVSLSASKMAGLKAYNQAQIEPSEIDILEVHDCFSIAEILALEDLGFYKKGEGHWAVKNGEVKIGGKRPVNLSGGLKACGHPVGATGVKQIVELVKQLRSQKAKNGQKIRLALAHNVGGSGGTCAVHILEKN